MSSSNELACVYAALILADDQVAVTADKLQTILKAANVSVEPYWPTLFARKKQPSIRSDLDKAVFQSKISDKFKSHQRLILLFQTHIACLMFVKHKNNLSIVMGKKNNRYKIKEAERFGEQEFMLKV